MGLRTLTSLQKVLLAAIIFILVGYVGYFVVSGRSTESVIRSDESVSGNNFTSRCFTRDDFGKISTQDNNTNDLTCKICKCTEGSSLGDVGGKIYFELKSSIVLTKSGSVGSRSQVNWENINSNACYGGVYYEADVCSIAQSTLYFNAAPGECGLYSIDNNVGTLVASRAKIYTSFTRSAVNFNDLTGPQCQTGTVSTNTPGSNQDGNTSGLLPGCGTAEDGTPNQCGVGGSLEGQCSNSTMWEQGFYACVRQTGGGGGGAPAQPLTYPSVRCTNMGSYVDPETGRAGRKKCTPNAEGSPRICLETIVPVRGNASSGNGRCVEKNNAAGQVCRFGIQCAVEKDKAPGLAADYEVTGQLMRCEKRDNATGAVQSQGICLPRFRGETLGCGVQGDTDVERDAYCKEVYAEYETIVEGENSGKNYEKLDFADQAYCHKLRNAAGTEVVNRFVCRLQRGEGRPCNPNAGNMCQDGLTCAIVKGQNKYACQVPLIR